MLSLHWFKCGKAPNNNWCNFDNLNLTTVTEAGVYVIWHHGNPSHTVYVGQGSPIADRIAKHRTDARITAYRNKGMSVTWATVPAAQRDGVERYLADLLDPLVGDAHPNVLPIAVNSPFG